MNSSEVKFGIPNQRSKKVKIEYLPEHPVMTVCKDEGKGTSKMILFNRKAINMLSEVEDMIPATISFSFYENPPLICNTSDLSLPDTEAHKMYDNKDYEGGYIRNLKIWKYINDKYGLNINEDSHFILSEANVGGISKSVSFDSYEEVKDYSEASTKESEPEFYTEDTQEEYSTEQY